MEMFGSCKDRLRRTETLEFSLLVPVTPSQVVLPLDQQLACRNRFHRRSLARRLTWKSWLSDYWTIAQE